VIWRNAAAGALLIIGLSQMAGELTGNRILKGLGAVTCIAPCPKVFCDMNGFEPFAADFAITQEEKGSISVPITPTLYSRMKGPYNRRNVYGAAIAGAPLLPEPIRRHVLNYAFAHGGSLRDEFGLPAGGGSIGITIRDKTRGRDANWYFQCEE
jgi:hypothetical protein